MWIQRFAIAGFLCFASLPADAQSCSSLKVVGGTGTQVQKTVSPPGAEIVRNNWNTDFSVPSTQAYRRFVATIMPKNEGQYRVQMSLKYNDGSVDKVYDQTITLTKNKAVTITGSRRLNANPYQVNLFIGGVPVVGNSYTASVAGCN